MTNSDLGAAPAIVAPSAPSEAEGRPVMSIRSKMRATFLFASGLVVILVGLAIRLEFSTIRVAATLEAEQIASSVAAVGLGRSDHDGTQLQKYVAQLSDRYDRDLVVVDATEKGIADADPTEIGQQFTHDKNDEVAATIADGQPRLFMEKNLHHPGGIMQIVVPLRQTAGDMKSPVVGAVIVEYTPLYDALIAAERNTLILMSAIGAAAVTLLLVVGSRLSNSVGRRLKELKIGVASAAAGGTLERIPERSRDEIGEVVAAFNKMNDDLQRAGEQLSQQRRILEQRTSELSAANITLQSEIQEKQRANERSEQLAHYDSLTTLPNRRMFSTLLERGVANAARYKKKLAVLFFDLDRFKNINDTLGHGAGDLLLTEISQRLKACLRASDTVARLGGDEFVILLPELNTDADAANVAQNVLSAIFQPIMLVGEEFRITASMGICVYPEGGEDEQTLMRNADIAMYRAKEEGKNTFKFYSKTMNSNSFGHLALESSLRLALERDEFVLHYQPKLALGSDQITGMEALLRWQHPVLGTVPPIKFIPIAEETGLIVPLGIWVLKTACRQNVAWQKIGLPHLCIAVNLSPRQFSDENLLVDIAAALQESGMEPTLLELEITEGMLMHDVAKAMKTLTALRDMGVRLAIDDFGTGYSSLSQLKRFPVNTIKVDRSFVRDLDTNKDDRGITEAIIAMGRSLSLTVVAEGVETQGQLEFLRQHNCDEFQGYYFSKPVPADEFAQLLRAHTAGPDSGRGRSGAAA